MSRFKAISPESATGKAKDLLDAVNAKLGMVPNMMRAMANAPAVLDGYLNLSGSLGKGTLSAKTPVVRLPRPVLDAEIVEDIEDLGEVIYARRRERMN